MEDQPEVIDRAAGLSDTLADEEVAYRPVSALAVVGLLLAIVSVLALASRWFVLLPVVAAVACLAAAHKVRRDPEANSGFGLAAAGLAVALLILGAVVAKRPVAQMLHAQSSGVVAQAFVDRLVEGDLVGAHELTVPFNNRRTTPELAKAFYASDPAAKEKMQEFSAHNVVQTLSEDGAAVPQVLEHTDAAVARGRRLSTIWVFRVPGQPGRPDAGLSVQLERPISSRFDDIAWYVANFDFVPLVK